MCGFTGAVSFKEIDNDLLKHSNSHSICRGPDNLSNIIGNDGIYYDLWFNRLSIIDLSAEANQPMISDKTNSVLMFNGEIYNSKTLRNSSLKDLYDFKTSHSDTETLLAGLENYGIKFIENLEGQFSFFYLDKVNQKIFLAKDRLGQKPLYVRLEDNELLFASNLKSVSELCKKNEINIESLEQYIAYGVSFSPNTIFKNILKIKPGSYLEIDYAKGNLNVKENHYWSPDKFIDNKKFNYDVFEELFSKSVTKRMVSDVPVASFLSGGIDSTSIVKNLSDSNYDVNTFSVIVKNKKYNEKKYIDEVVKKYNTNHKEVLIDDSISTNIVLSAIRSLDEPFSDPSIVPTYYLSKLMALDYKVAISGDGGDELLGGYDRVKNHLINKSTTKDYFNKIYKYYPPNFGTGTNFKSLSNNQVEAYVSFLEDQKLFNFLFDKKLDEKLRIKVNEGNSLYKRLLCADYKYYLVDQMMYKVDRASMSNSLEVRSPFVDHKLIEYVLGHSTEYFQNKIQKLPLRNYLQYDFDKGFLDRPKQGFVFDYKKWVFSNYEYIADEISNSNLSDYIKLENLYKLKKIPTRVNALRIWRFFVLAIYLNDIR